MTLRSRSSIINPAVPGSGRAFVLGLPEFKSSATLVNIQLVASCQLGFLILLCYVVFELFVSKYLRGVSVNQLDELSALSIISKPLIRTFLQRLQCSTSEKRALILTRFRDIVPTIKFRKKERRDQFCDSELHEVGVDKKQSALWVAPFFRNGFLLILTR